MKQAPGSDMLGMLLWPRWSRPLPFPFAGGLPCGASVWMCTRDAASERLRAVIEVEKKLRSLKSKIAAQTSSLREEDGEYDIQQEHEEEMD